MPTKRTRQQRTNIGALSATHWAWLRGEPFDREEHDWFVYMALQSLKDWPPIDPPARPWLASGVTGRALWAEHGAEIVEQHVAEYPGSRPAHWWTFTAPEGRRRLGGTGTPRAECLADPPSFHLGVPARWGSASEVNYFNGRALDVAGNPIQNGNRPGDFPHPAIDPRDPPLFESEAAYLARLSLFLPQERRRLNPADFRPESVAGILGLGLSGDD